MADLMQQALLEQARREQESRQEEPRTFGQNALRATGLTARAALEGAHDVVSPFTNAASGLINLGLEATPIERRLPEQTQNFSNILSDLGLPSPETTAEKAGNIGARFVTGLATGRPVSNAVLKTAGLPTATAATKLKAPTVDQLRTQANAAYRSAENAGVNIAKDSFKTTVDDIQAAVTKAGIDPTLHPKATAAMERLISATGDDIPFDQLEILRRVAKGASKSIEADERRVGQVIINGLDDFVGGLSPKQVTSGDAKVASNAISTARNLWTRLSKGETIENMIDRAKVRAPNFSASGFENSLRVEFRQLALNPKRMRLFTPAEQAAIRKVAQGGKLDNALRMLGKAAPRGVITTALGGGAGFAVAGPAGAGAVLGTGEAARAGATALTLRNARLASELARRGGPAIEGALPGLPAALRGAPFPLAALSNQLLDEQGNALAGQ